MPIQDSWLIQEFQLCNNLVQQAIGALHKNRLKRAEKLLQEAAKVVERLKLWQPNLPPDQSNSGIADAVEKLHKTMLDQQNGFLQLRNGPTVQHSR